MPELWCDFCNRGAEGCLHPVPVYLVIDGVPIVRMLGRSGGVVTPDLGQGPEFWRAYHSVHGHDAEGRCTA